MLRKVLPLFLAILSVFSAVLLVSPREVSFAQENDDVLEEVNSYELFWPLAAGKTSEDSLYSLKRLKEKVRGLLILGADKKVDYKVFLAEKRLLEAEKLLESQKSEAAGQTIDSSLKELEVGDKGIAAITGPTATTANIVNRLGNLQKFLPFLQRKYQDHADHFQELINVVDSMYSKL